MTPEQILQTEFSEKFVGHMKDAMTVSYYKYGPLVNGFPDKVDALGSLMMRLEEYAKTGNTEYLVDVANFAMIEFMHPRHESAHYKATDDDGSPGRRAARSDRRDKRDNESIDTNPQSSTAKFR